VTTKLKCLLLDDELPGLTYLKMLCEQIPELEIVKVYDDPAKLLAELPSLSFDLLISDIEMPGIDGFTLATQLERKLVIFITAYTEYAVDAFAIDAVDYITKPVKIERLQKAVERFGNMPAKKFLQVNTDKGRTLLYFAEVILIRASANDSRDKEVLLRNQSRMLLKNVSFDQLLDEFPLSQFCWISKKEVIALVAVKFFSHNEIILDQPDPAGQAIRVSLNEKYRAKFLQLVKI
jgi:DNA-binding LytR/AlgR family response regulator